MTRSASRSVAVLTDLADRLRHAKGFAEVLAALKKGRSGTIDGAWGSSCALAAAAIMNEAASPLVIVLPRPRELDEFAADLESFTGTAPIQFPAWELLPQEQNIGDPVFGQRLQLLRTLESGRTPAVILTTIQALLQPVPSRERRFAGTRTLKTGEELDLQDCLKWLIERGFERVPAVELPGEFSLHGGILDVYSPDRADPVRIELFGDEIESIRLFDVESQRKLEDLTEFAFSVIGGPQGRSLPTQSWVSPSMLASDSERVPSGGAGDSSGGLLPESRQSLIASDTGHFCDSLPSTARVVIVELQELFTEAKLYVDRLSDRRGLFTVGATVERLTRFPSVTLAPLSAASLEVTCHLQVESIERFTTTKAETLRELAGIVQRDEAVLIACHNDGSRQRLAELLKESVPDLLPRVTLCLGTVSHGFRMVADRLLILSDNELFGRHDVHRTTRRKRLESRVIDSFLELAEGDLIVHLKHGIGRFRGMELVEKDGQVEEHLHLEFRDGAQLYVPVALIHLVQKYVGGTKSAPELAKLGGTAWAKKKQKVTEAVADMASDLLQLQAERDSKPGITFPPDSHWMQEFEAEFPYTETDDQLRAISDIKGDMEKPRPMDRLICGDVGYGKTEVAIRAAFKAVDAGKQVAVLVPTTVLAEQHYRSFSERMAEFPITLAALSRFKTKREQKEILAGLAEGRIDIVIGTHRLVQKDVKFKDLGLLVIDEEQRFGVEAKEMLKQLRLEVDVLTLSATPIPRTLHLSLVGIRDISNLETPPQDRIAVETRLARFEPEVIRQAIVRELNRNGQVYFVHNKVYDIQIIADKLRSIVPEAKVDVIHGQMTEDELERALISFVNRQTDVLVATTIIESGIDVPSANTMFIHLPENYGLADLHQLRGRVGRSHHRAYCYLLMEEGKFINPQAAKRLKAIQEFSELGAGFKISMRDLEIRGAGNILGTEQSGHIAVVGYELYCQLLENAVRAVKRQPLKEFRHVAVDLPISAYFPTDYVPPGRHKIEMYRKLSTVENLQQLEQYTTELRDRFGPIPLPAQKMIEIRELQLLAMPWQIDEIRLEDDYAVFGYRNPKKIRKLAELSPFSLRIVDERSAYLVLPRSINLEESLLNVLKHVLKSQPQAPAPTKPPLAPTSTAPLQSRLKSRKPNP